MTIYFRKSYTYNSHPDKLKGTGWDYFVNISKCATEFEIVHEFCKVLYSPAMGPLRSMFNRNYFNDMMAEFFGDHLGKKIVIGVYPAQNLWQLGGETSADIVTEFQRAIEAAISFIEKRRPGSITVIDAERLSNNIAIIFVTD